MHIPGDSQFSEPTLNDASRGRPSRGAGGPVNHGGVPGGPSGPGGPGGPGAPGGPSGPVAPRRRRTRRRIVRVLGVLVLALVLLVVGMWIYADRSLHRVDALADYSGRPAAGSGTNWLIVGSDSRQGLTDAQAAKLHTGDAQSVGGARTDTIMLLHLPGNGSKPTMVSLLRDSEVSIPGYNRDKINAAYSDGGPKLLVQTVEQNTGLRIDHYAEIGLGGFANVVDDVGGVRMCLDQAVNDQYSGINLRAGCQTLNGPNALGYVRSRHAFATSDFARTEHQRQFVGALAGKLTSPGVLLNPFQSVPAMLDLPKGLTVDRGAGVWDLITLAWHVRHFSNVTSIPVPIGGSDGSNLLWDPTKSQELFHDLNHDLPLSADLTSH